MDKIISKYTNGNYKVTIFDDGTKIRCNDLDNLTPEFPESMDIKISNQCPFGCAMCHEKSTPEGLKADLIDDKEISDFIESLHNGTELAIGGGAVTYHPQLIPFLLKLKKKNIIASITVNLRELEKEDTCEMIKNLIDEKLIYGLGVSYTEDVPTTDEFWTELLKQPNVVIHLIAGYHDIQTFQYFANKGAKILILGYKQFGRGDDYYKEHKKDINLQIQSLNQILPELREKAKVLSFDNLALKQLDVRRLLSEEEWNEFYMGDDGNYTMYVDLVNKQCAVSSTSKERFPLKDFNILWNNIKYSKKG